MENPPRNWMTAETRTPAMVAAGTWWMPIGLLGLTAWGARASWKGQPEGLSEMGKREVYPFHHELLTSFNPFCRWFLGHFQVLNLGQDGES